MTRPYKIKNLRTGRVRSFGQADSAMEHVAMFAGPGLDRFAADYVWVEPDGAEYPLPAIVATMKTLQRIYDVGRQLVP